MVLSYLFTTQSRLKLKMREFVWCLQNKECFAKGETLKRERESEEREKIMERTPEKGIRGMFARLTLLAPSMVFLSMEEDAQR